jgi:hypothetical protein
MKAFLSYMNENIERVRELADDLKASGVPVFLDRDKLIPGLEWGPALQLAIRQGFFFLCCISRAAQRRQVGYFFEELELALAILKSNPPGRPWFLPVLLDSTTIEDFLKWTTIDLRAYHAVRMNEDWSAGIRSVLKAMRLDDPKQRKIQILMDTLENDETMRGRAAKELAAMGEALLPAIPYLVALLSRSNRTVHIAVLEVLSACGKNARDALPALIDLLRSEDREIVCSVIKVLHRIGPDAACAVPGLVQVLDRRPPFSVKQQYSIQYSIQRFDRFRCSFERSSPAALNSL